MNKESQDAIQLFSFNEINFDDTFFNSLRGDYPEFMNWVARKKDQGENAYVLIGESGQIDGFLYLKEEYDVNSDITPLLPGERHIKIGTFKVNAHNTVLGQRFLSLALLSGETIDEMKWCSTKTGARLEIFTMIFP